MDDKDAIKRMRQGQFVANNGRVLRIINLLRHKYERCLLYTSSCV